MKKVLAALVLLPFLPLLLPLIGMYCLAKGIWNLLDWAADELGILK